MRQTKIGRWPGMSLHAVVVEWEKLRSVRDVGGDPAMDAKHARAEKVRASAQTAALDLSHAHS